MSRGEAQKKAWKSWGWTLTLHFLGRLKGQEGLGCVTEKEKVFRQKELRHTRSGNTKYTGLELEGHWEEGPASGGHGQCGSCRTVGQGTL